MIDAYPPFPQERGYPEGGGEALHGATSAAGNLTQHLLLRIFGDVPDSGLSVDLLFGLAPAEFAPQLALVGTKEIAEHFSAIGAGRRQSVGAVYP